MEQSSNLTIEGKQIESMALREAEREEDIPFYAELSAYAMATLSFCRQWLRGQTHFTLYTSGSTGTPKPITIYRQQMEASARMTIKSLQLSSTDTALVCMNTAYIAGRMMLVRGLEAGMPLVIQPPSSQPFRGLSTEMQIQFTALVPLQVQALLKDEAQLERLNQLKALLIGGAPVSYHLQQEIRSKVEAPVYVTYGMTETVSHIALKKLNGTKPEDTYTVLEGVVIGTDDKQCLTIQGNVTNNQLLVTHDVVNLIDARHFEWIGRADHVINSGGFKVFPEKVEVAIARFMAEEKNTTAFFVGGMPDERLGQQAVLLLEGAASPAVFEEKLFTFLRQHLHPYEIPKRIYYVPAFSMTSTGKVQRQKTLRNLSTTSK